AMLADKDVEGVLELLEPVADRLVVTRNTSPRAMPVHRLAELAAEIFGEDRVTAEADLPDAIEAAVALAEENIDAGISGVGIVSLAVACVVLAGLLRHRSAWYAGIGLQVARAACGVFNLALLAMGILFGAVWGYVLSVRRRVLGKI